MTPLYKKDERLLCTKCGAHILTFACDLFSGDRLEAGNIKKEGGQAPWGSRARLNCRDCGSDFSRHLLLKTCTSKIRDSKFIAHTFKESSNDSATIPETRKENRYNNGLY
jgi:hypothetical protein